MPQTYDYTSRNIITPLFVSEVQNRFCSLTFVSSYRYIKLNLTFQKSESEPEEDNDEPVDNDQESFETESFQSDYNIPLNVVEVDRPSTTIKHTTPADDGYKNKRAKTSTEVDDEYDAIGI